MALVAIGSVFIGSADIVLVLISSAKDGVAPIIKAASETAATPLTRYLAKELRTVMLHLSDHAKCLVTPTYSPAPHPALRLHRNVMETAKLRWRIGGVRRPVRSNCVLPKKDR